MLKVEALICPKCGETNEPHRNIDLDRGCATCRACAHSGPVSTFQLKENRV